MGKLKSHSGAKKRVWRTGSGKLAMVRNSRNHLLQQKSAKAKRRSRTLVVSAVEDRKLRALLPNL